MRRILYLTFIGVLLAMFGMSATPGASTSDNKGKPGDRTVAKKPNGTTSHVTVRTTDGYQVRDRNGRLIYRVVENSREKRVYDSTGRLVSRESKPASTRNR